MSSELIVEDRLAYPTMLRLAGCLGTMLDDAGLPKPCFLGIMPGGTAPWDFCGCGKNQCGQAWVRLVSVFPSVAFPNPEVNATCVSKLAYQLEVGIIRCMPGLDARGNPPSVEEQLAAARIQMADMAVMHRAISCCMQSGTDKRYVLGTYSPLENQGDCGGGIWTVTIEG